MTRIARIRLVEERKRRGWSQRELADHLGTTQHNVSRWEAGVTAPGPYFRAKLGELFGASAHELGLLDTDSPPSQEKAAEEKASTSASTQPLTLWTVPFLRNPHFTGREKVLECLDQRFPAPNDEKPVPLRHAALTQPQAIKGLGGIGKTQIAVEYAYRARERGCYTHILWVHAANEEAILTSFATLAEMIPAVAATREIDQHQLVATTIHWLERCTEPWLLIFDDAGDFALLQPYLPQQGNGNILFTTRAYAVGAFASSIEVEKMGLVEGTILLLHRAQYQQAPDEERNEATNIVIALDGFPLALDQAGAYIEETGCRFTEYLQLYQQHHQFLLARRGRQATNYPDSVATTWSLSFHYLEQHHPAAAELLRLCAFLAPDAIPEELLVEGAAHWPPVLQQAIADRLTFNHALEALLNFSLIKRQRETRGLSLHRLVQVVLRDTMKPATQQQWAERVVRAMHVLFPEPVEIATWARCQHYLPQAQVCSGFIRDFSLTFGAAASLLERIARYLQEAGLYAQAESVFQQVRHLYEQQSGSNSVETLGSLNGLATIYQAQGKYREAETLFQHILHIREQTLGSEHLDVAQSLDSLARLLNRRGNYKDAEPLCLRALRIREQALGSEHLDVAQSLLRLASTYNYQEKYEEARPLYQHVLHLREQALGPDHRLVASVLNDLAEAYRALGKYREAEPLYQRALQIWEHLLGPEHPDVAAPLHNLGELYQAQGNYAQAEPLYQRALQIWEQRLGPEHPAVASPLNGLATLYARQRKYGEAAVLFQRTVQILEQHLGEYHVETAKTLHDFATVQEAQGKHQEAASLYQRALAAQEQIVGEAHPLTVAIRIKYLTLLSAMEGRDINDIVNLRKE